MKKILHVDMDCFYAAVEVLDNPKLKGLPVIVGGNPNSRGVVATASYEARKFGVHSAMSSAEAYRRCPHGVFVHGNFKRYREVSQQVHEIFRRYTNLIEPLSLDEAWLDVTTNSMNEVSATRLAQRIQKEILEEVGITCSIGVSYNKFLAKIASDEKKPFGITVIPPEGAQAFLDRLELKKIPGVGKVTQKRLEALNCHYGKDLREKDMAFLLQNFGKFGTSLYQRVRGIDEREVVVERVRKSLSTEHTFEEDYSYGAELLEKLHAVCLELEERLKQREFLGRTLILKVKFDDFKQVTRNISNDQNIYSIYDLFMYSQEKLQEVCDAFPEKKIRLLGVGVSNTEKENVQQLQLI